MKVLSLFSGIGAFEKALQKMNVDFDLVNYCEIDKYASKSYAAIHNVSEDLNLGDITKVDTSKLPNDIDLITYGFPCQDISLAGKQKGFTNEDGSSTRSGLFFEALRIIEDTKPKITIAENVKNLVGKRFKKEFEIVLESLEEAGYNNYWQVLNAKDYGIPQNRERVFIVSIRKDIDNNSFKFPKKEPLVLRLRDMLEKEVDEKYYLSDKLTNQILDWKAQQKPFEKVLGNNSICPTLTARGAGENHSGMIIYSDKLEETTNVQENYLKVKNATKKGYLEAYEGDSVNLAFATSNTRRGRVGEQVAQTLDTSCNQGVVVKESGSSYLRKFGSRGKLQDPDGVCDTLVAVMGTGGGNVPIVSEKEFIENKFTEEGYSEKSLEKIKRNIKDPDGVSSTITANPQRATIDGGNLIVEEKESLWTETQAKMITPEGNVRRYIDSDVVDLFGEGQVADISFPNGYNKGPRVHNECPALNTTTTRSSFVVKVEEELGIIYRLRIRKLTPRECYRLMGFKDCDFDNAKAIGISDSQLYKQAGNSIVVNVLEKLLENLMEVFEVKKTKIVVTYETDKMINLELLKEQEPELFEELSKDYPVNEGTYIYEVKKGA